jgi:hypothetical protein
VGVQQGKQSETAPLDFFTDDSKQEREIRWPFFAAFHVAASLFASITKCASRQHCLPACTATSNGDRAGLHNFWLMERSQTPLMKTDPDDLKFLRELYTSARNRYKPSHIKTLLLAEAPPNNTERYFYFEDVRTHDSLFLEIMGVLYPEEKRRYLASGREADRKKNLLQTFREDGYWLMNLSELPIGLSGISPESLLPSLLLRLKKTITRQTPIILIQASLYDLCYPVLMANGYNASSERLPFPGNGQQGVFRGKFRKAINRIDT